MVVVPKRSEAAYICIDFPPLNSKALREVYPLPEVDENLAGEIVFIKLDSNWIELLQLLQRQSLPQIWHPLVLMSDINVNVLSALQVNLNFSQKRSVSKYIQNSG